MLQADDIIFMSCTNDRMRKIHQEQNWEQDITKFSLALICGSHLISNQEITNFLVLTLSCLNVFLTVIRIISSIRLGGE